MKMVDGVLLVVDAYDGRRRKPSSSSRRRLKRRQALVVINKIDRGKCPSHKVLDMVFELFLELNAPISSSISP